MAFNLGAMTMYDDTNSIADPTVMVAAKAIDLATHKGAFYQALSSPMAPLKTVDFEIYNRSKTATGGTITEALNDSETTVTLDTTSIDGITVGHVILIDSEYMWVGSITSRAAGTVVVSRGYGGTTPASHLDDAVYSVVTLAINDSDLKNVESAFENTGVYTNYAQLFPETIDWEKGNEIYKRKGLVGEQIKPVLVKEATVRIAERLAYTALHGKKQIGTSVLPYATDGLLNQLVDTASASRPTQTYNCAGAFTEAKFRAALLQVSLVPGGMPTVAWMSATNKEIANGFLRSLTIINNLQATQAGYSVDSYNYNGSIISLRIDADMPDDKIAIVNQAKCYMKWVEGDGLTFNDEPSLSSRESRKSITGSMGIAIEDVGYEHILMYGIT